MITLYIVAPCYNEEAILRISAERLSNLYDSLMAKNKISKESRILFVNDGSLDTTWRIIECLHKENELFRGLNLAHNVGHQHAIMAGMLFAKNYSDAIVTIDADLQDDLNCIEQMLDAYSHGFDVVYGVKVSRDADPILKRLSAQAFYKLQEAMGVSIIYNHADFRFLSKRVLNALSNYPERNLYLRGLIPTIGFPSTTVDDVIAERVAGESKYSLGKMLNLALDGITSFSIKPLFFVTYSGIFYIIISLFIGVYVLYSLLIGTAVRGWSSLIFSIWFVGGAIMLSIGIVGTYVGKIYNETKNRPLFTIQDVL